MNHRLELLQQHDAYIESLLQRQLTAPEDPRYGGFWTDAFHVEPRQSGFFLGDMIAAYCTEDSRWYLSHRHLRAMPSFPSQLEWKIGLAWANTRGILNSPS